MKKFRIKVTESIHHEYEFEAENEDEAIEKYHSMSNLDLKDRDLDGSIDWDVPWDIEVEEI